MGKKELEIKWPNGRKGLRCKRSGEGRRESQVSEVDRNKIQAESLSMTKVNEIASEGSRHQILEGRYLLLRTGARRRERREGEMEIEMGAAMGVEEINVADYGCGVIV